MKITLISPYPDLYAMGIRNLSAYLKARKHDVSLIFLPQDYTKRFNERTLKDIIELSKGSKLIGISLMTNIFYNAIQITKALKENCGIPILWGGIHPTLAPEECIKYADIVCIGEGEEVSGELAKRIEGGQDYYGIQGIWFNEKDKIIKNEKRLLMQELDILPFQDFDYKSHYILNDGYLHEMNPGLLNQGLRGTYTIMATRGCPFGCTYCCNFAFNKLYPQQKSVRKRSIDNVIKELIEVKIRLPFVEKIAIADDAFLFYTEKEIKEFCKKYTENVGLPFTVMGGATPTTLSREKLKLLVGAGMESLKIGIQSASERIKRLYNRCHSNEQVEEAVNLINEFKDKIPMPHYDILLDNPWETDEELIETLMFVSKLPSPYQLNTYSLTFYPGTALYEKAKIDGIVADEEKDIYNKDYLYYGFKKKYLNRLFFLLNEYAFYSARISPKMMRVLTNSKIIRMKLHWLLYGFLKANAFYLKRKRLIILIRQGINDIKKGIGLIYERNFCGGFESIMI